MKWFQSRADLVKNSVAVFAVLLVTVVGVKLLSASHAATGAVLSMTPSTIAPAPGSTFSVTVQEDSGTDTVNSVQASLNYDASQLQYVSMTEGTAFPTVAANQTTTPGVVRVGRATSTPVSGTNTVVTINFKVLAASGASVSLTYDRNFSFVVSSATNTDILTATTGTTATVSGTSAGAATLYTQSTNTTVAAGSTFTVQVRENSGTTAVNSVQAALNYDATKLQYVSMTEGGTFTNQAATDTATAGVVRVARAVQAGSVGASGDNPIVTISFKVIASTAGTTAVSFNKVQSFVVASSTGQDILGTVAGTTYTITVPAAAKGTLALSPATGSFTSGSTISVDVTATSASAALTTVQATLNYPALLLQFVSVTEGGVFTTAQRTNSATPGTVDLIRSLPGGSAGVVGTNKVITVNFKVIATSGTMPISFASTSALFDDSGTGTNILDMLGSTGASYTVTSTPSPTPSPTPAPTPAPTPTPTPSPTASPTPPLSTPDLVVTGVTWSPASPVAGDAVTFSVTVKNQGTAATAAGTIVGAAVSVDGTVTNWSDTSTTSLAAGASRTLTANSGPASSATWNAVAGTHTILATADNANRIVEASETNNTFSLPLTVGAQQASGATLGMSPVSGSFATNSTISVAISATSPVSKLTTVQATLNYPASQLQFVSVTEGTVFTTAQRTNSATPGTVDLIRSLPGGTAGVVGTNPVITVNFKVIGTAGTAAVTFAGTSAAFDDSGTGTNILNLSGSASANYTVASAPACTTAPSTPGMAARTAFTYTTITMVWFASTPAANCTLAGYHVFRDGVLAGDVTSGTSFVDSGLKAGEQHSYTVQAFDTAGHVSGQSTSALLASKVDDQAPTTPVGITAAAPNAVSVNLGWSQSTDFPNPGGVGVAGYKIYRNGAATATYSVAGATTFTDSNVAAGTTYSYIVTAFDSAGNESAPSNIVSARTADAPVTCTGNPSVPTGVSGSSVAMTTADLSWTASTPAAGCTLSGYRVFRNASFVASSATPTFHDTGLAPGTSYTYTLQAIDTAGHVSALTTGVVVRTAVDTQAPAPPSSATATALSSSQVTVAWTGTTDNVAVTGYRIYRGGTLIQTVAGTVRTYTDTTVTANTNYIYAVSAIDAAGNESTRTTALPNPVHTPAAADTQAPTVPSALNALSITTTAVALGWTGSTDNVAVAGYHVYRGGVLVGDAPTPSFSNTGLTPATTYSFTVRAFDAAGNTSAASQALSVTTTSTVVCLVGDLNCSGSVDIFDLSTMMTHWNEVNVPVKFGDINQDGIVDVFDLSALLSHLGGTA